VNECLTIFSCKDIAEVESLGGVGWFRLNSQRVEACRYVVVFHNAHDRRKPGDPAHHRFPVLVAEICGTHVDPTDGRAAVRARRVAPAEGPRQVCGGRSPVKYEEDSLLDKLKIGSWRHVKQTTLEEALADRSSWDARHHASPTR
jgi:hypothetical protein